MALVILCQSISYPAVNRINTTINSTITFSGFISSIMLNKEGPNNNPAIIIMVEYGILFFLYFISKYEKTNPKISQIVKSIVNRLI